MAGANDDLAAKIRAWVRQHATGAGRVKIRCDLINGVIKDLAIRWLPARGADVGEGVETLVSAPSASTSSHDFTPTEGQMCILEALEGKAMKGGDLERAVGLERSQLYRLMRQLQAADPPLICRHASMGYYRPDAPPLELAE